MPRKPATPEVAKVASIEGANAPDVQKLLDQIADLEKQLGHEKEARTEAEEKALQAARLQMGSTAQEVPTGKKVKVQRCKEYETVSYKDDGRPILKPKWHTIELETFFYHVDLPPVGGEGLVVNGLPLAHGVTYEFDIDTLRSVKDMVHKVWDHERNIHGTDENIFRKPVHRTLRGGEGRA